VPRLSFEAELTLGNVIQIALIVGGFIATWVSLSSDVKDLEGLKPRVEQLESSNASFNTRLTVVESRAETQSLSITKLTEAVDELGTQVQALAITAATTKTDVGYIRDYIEDAKRALREAK